MILKSVGVVGSYEIVYSLVVSLLRRIPTLLTFFQTAPTFAVQVLLLVAVILCVDVIIAVIDLFKRFKEWLDSKL